VKEDNNLSLIEFERITMVMWEQGFG
jgi:hypothetical protein